MIYQELRNANQELKDICEAIQIGFIYVDDELRIRRYNSRAENLFEMNRSDLGKSLSLISHRLQYLDLVEDIRQTLNDLKPVTKLITGENKQSYIFKIEPYKANDNTKGSLITFVDITDLKQTLKESIEDKKRLEHEILSIEKKERWRIGQYLHDETAQTLVSAQMLTNIVLTKIKRVDEKTKKDLHRIKNFIDKSLDNIRELSHFVLPIEIGKGGISSAFQKLAKQTEDLYHIECTFSSDDTINELADLSSASYLYYIAQEAIRNAITHGEAKKITVDLSSSPQYIYLQVEDDGKGYEKSDENKGLGINIMRYRAELLGGTLQIEKAPNGKGTFLKCCIPLEKLKEK